MSWDMRLSRALIGQLEKQDLIGPDKTRLQLQDWVCARQGLENCENYVSKYPQQMCNVYPTKTRILQANKKQNI